MAPIPIGAKNPRLRLLKQLVGRPKARSQERAFVVDGPRLVVDAMRAGLEVKEIFASAEAIAALGRETARLASPESDRSGSSQDWFDGIEVYEVVPSVLGAVLDPVNPQPIAAVVAFPDWSAEDLLADDRPLLVAVELRDPGNLGTVIRTAEAAGLAGVIVAGDSVDRFSPKVVRASAGSVFRLPVIATEEPVATVGQLLERGRNVVAAVVEPGAPSYDTRDLTGAAILIGNEPHGLPAEVVAAVTEPVTIPMADGVESLNVGAAASVLCFEAARQRRNLTSSGQKSGGQPPVSRPSCPQ